MSNLSDAKQSLVLYVSATGLTNLDALAERYGLRRTGVVMLAVRICGMAHGCGNDGTLFIRESGGGFIRVTFGKCFPVRESADMRQVALVCSPRERAKLVRCARQAGSMGRGIETALKFLLDVSSVEGMNLFERLGSVYYPALRWTR